MSALNRPSRDRKAEEKRKRDAPTREKAEPSPPPGLTQRRQGRQEKPDMLLCDLCALA